MSDTEANAQTTEPEDMSVDDFLVTRRSKRSTAGNRMEAALAEMTFADTKDNVDDDQEFLLEKDEQDIFESDFESTDEEAEVANQAEMQLQDVEVHRPKRGIGSRLDRVTAAANARQKATFNPVSEAQPVASTSKLRSRAAPSQSLKKDKNQRQSRRKSTVLNTTATAKRVKKAEARRATLIKRNVPTTDVIFSQTAMLDQALDTEEGNIFDHKHYLAIEEERRRRVKIVRKGIDGEKLRWISRVEDVKDIPQPLEAGNPDSTMQDDTLPTEDPIITIKPAEKTTKNYIIHDNGPPGVIHHHDDSKPTWGATMTALFGDHTDWSSVRVLTGKNRPMGRPKDTCLITGRRAIYRDSRTMVPFANVEGYNTITRVLANEYTWSSEFAAYIGVRESQ